MIPFGPAGRDLWDALHGLESNTGAKLRWRPDEGVLLREACHLADDLEVLRTMLAERPLLVPGSMGQMRVDPLRGELHRTSQRLESLLRSLQVPDQDVSVSARTLADRRWGARGA
ncbi:MAG: hypothetical protein WD651_06595 [Acidimicrobiia bacterium]